MKTMKWLIRRELWEHKGMLVWAPAAIAAVIAALALIATFLNQHMSLNGEEMTPQNIIVTIEGETRTRIVDTMAQGYVISAAPVYMVLGFLVFFYCLGALHDERRDRSMLFWKSLPVSDLTTVASKALMALVIAPLIVIGIALSMSLLLLLAVCVKVALHGTNLFGELLMTPELYLTPLRVLALLPVYILWALPTVGWLLMISSMVRSKVFLWAVGIPVVTGLVLLWAEKALGFGVNAPWFISNVIKRLLLGVVPGSWLGFTPRMQELGDDHLTHGIAAAIFNESWASLAQPGVWLGVVAGIAMLAAAVRMRRRREEG